MNALPMDVACNCAEPHLQDPWRDPPTCHHCGGVIDLSKFVTAECKEYIKHLDAQWSGKSGVELFILADAYVWPATANSVVKGTCECGAAKCGDHQHSAWCPLA